MKTFSLNATPRTDLGKSASKALRAEDKVPAVINGGKPVELPYNGELKAGQKLVEIANGKGVIVTDLAINVADVRNLIYTPEIFVIDLTIEGQAAPVKAVLKDLQFHPVSDALLHIDLLEVNDSEPVVMEVPVKLEGHAAGVKAGGKLNLMMKKLKVKALYNNIPEKIVVNIDNIQLGQSLKIGELHYEGLELINSKNAVVCAVQLTRAARGAQATAQ